MTTTRLIPPGQILGDAGSGLVNADWAASKFVANLGRKGEIRTAVHLNALASTPGGPTVLHHVQFPGTTADIDHIVVSGRTVTLIDTKVWKPATYVTFRGRHLRFLSLLSHEEAENVPSLADVELARARTRRHLSERGIEDVEIIGPVYVVWPSKEDRTVSAQMLDLGPGTSIIPASQLPRRAKSFARSGPADRAIVAALASTFDKES